MKGYDKSFYELFKNFAAEEPYKLFMFDEERQFTAKDAFCCIKHIASQLYCAGVRKGENVVIRATRSIDTMFIFFAVQFIGGVACFTDPHEGAEQFIYSCGVNISPEWYITNEYASKDISARGGWVIYGKRAKIKNLEIKAEYDNKLNFDVSVSIYNPAVIIFTSGSTGKSKGVVLSQRNLLCHMYNYERAGCFKPYDISIELLPVHHVFGLTIAIYALYTRYSMFFPAEVHTEYVAECIARYGITRLDGVPTYDMALAEYKKENNFDSSSLRVGLIGGAPSTKEQFCFIESSLGIKLVPVYGMSECVAITGIPLDEPEEKRATTVGKFLPLHQGFISDGNGGRAKIGQEGEICVKSPVVMMGYYGDEDATAAAIDNGGALHTGDVGFVDDEGYVHVTGRLKDIIIRNGVNISAAKIERKILSLPCVYNASVVGVSDDRMGEIPCAAVVLNNGYELSEAELSDLLKNTLTKLEQPKELKILKNIPLTSSNKPDKQLIKRMF
ncbi:MAG: acyl--CoA ligase [Clostridia bacterium]|nr:acyl--CoA ligase [Clostridia bacterium]